MRFHACLPRTLPLLVLVLCPGGCGYTVVHERLVPVQATGPTDGVRIPCAQGHVRILPIEVNTRRGRQVSAFDHFTFAVEYTGMPASCSPDDVTLTRPGHGTTLPVEAVVKSRRYPDRPGTLTCFYRMRNILEDGATYHLNLHPAATGCPVQPVRYRHESKTEFRWAVEK